VTWGLPLVAVNKFWIANLTRDQLLDLVQGKANSILSLAPEQLIELSPPKGKITAIWRALGSADRSPLPQVILGDAPTLEDLFAWSASYLRGIGPITAQTRVITPDVFRIALRTRPENVWVRLASGAVGSILGEVLMHARRVISFGGVTLAACHSTLSFALMRAAALGVRGNELVDVADMWEQVRTQTGQAPTVVPMGAIRQAALGFAAARLEADYQSPNESNRWVTLLLGNGNVDALLKEIEVTFGPLPNELSLDGFRELTAEARVRVFDRVAPTLISHPTTSRVEKAFAIALTTYLCRAGMQQQVTLLAPFSATLPESMVWLGVMQGAVPFTETLAEGDGLGWRVARDLFQPGDIFAPPVCDIALSELQVLSRRRTGPRMIKALSKARLDVELLPGISTFVRTLQPEAPEQSALPLETKASTSSHPETASSPGLIPEDLFMDAEKALSALSRFLRTTRTQPAGGPVSDRKRRR
jgi:hypothetical protein